MNALLTLQQQAETAAMVGLLWSMAILGLMLWAAVWSHMAFKRWEQREIEKLEALKRIARSLNASNERGPEVMDFRATR